MTLTNQQILVQEALKFGINYYKAHKLDSKQRSESFWLAFYKNQTKSQPAEEELRILIDQEIIRLRKLLA